MASVVRFAFDLGDVPEQGHILGGGVGGRAAGAFLGLGFVLAEEAKGRANGLRAFGGIEGDFVGDCGGCVEEVGVEVEQLLEELHQVRDAAGRFFRARRAELAELLLGFGRLAIRAAGLEENRLRDDEAVRLASGPCRATCRGRTLRFWLPWLAPHPLVLGHSTTRPTGCKRRRLT